MFCKLHTGQLAHAVGASWSRDQELSPNRARMECGPGIPRFHYIQYTEFLKRKTLFLFQVLLHFPRTVPSKVPESVTSSDFAIEIYCLSSRGQKFEIKVQTSRAMLSLSSMGESFLSFCSFWYFDSNLWCSLVCRCNPVFMCYSVCLYVVFALCMSFSLSEFLPFFIRTSILLNQAHPHDIILT